MTAQQAPWADGVLVTTPTMTAIMKALGLDCLSPSWDGWVDDNSPGGWSAGTANAIDIPYVDVDSRSRYPIGCKLSFTDNGVTKYAYVVASSYSGVPFPGHNAVRLTVVVALADGTASTLSLNPITYPRISYMATPYGFPGAFSYAPSYTGWTATPTLDCHFAIQGRQMFLWLFANGTSTTGATTLSIPVAINASYPANSNVLCRVVDNGAVAVLGLAQASGGSTSFTFGKDLALDAFTTSGGKNVSLQTVIPI